MPDDVIKFSGTDGDKLQLYIIDTGWACGGVRCIDGVVVEAPPVFRKFIGQMIEPLKKYYKVYET